MQSGKFAGQTFDQAFGGKGQSSTESDQKLPGTKPADPSPPTEASTKPAEVPLADSKPTEPPKPPANAARFDREPPSDWPGTWRDAPKEKFSSADGTSPPNLAPQNITEPTSKIGGDLSGAEADESASAPNEQPRVTPTSTPTPSSEPQSPSTAAENSPQPSAMSSGLDKIQTTLDAL